MSKLSPASKEKSHQTLYRILENSVYGARAEQKFMEDTTLKQLTIEKQSLLFMVGYLEEQLHFTQSDERINDIRKQQNDLLTRIAEIEDTVKAELFPQVKQ
jgi:flagellar biosynthesis/type III secretory pathway chaperone